MSGEWLVVRGEKGDEGLQNPRWTGTMRMQREDLEKMNRQANKMTVEITTVVQESVSLHTVPA